MWHEPMDNIDYYPPETIAHPEPQQNPGLEFVQYTAFVKLVMNIEQQITLPEQDLLTEDLINIERIHGHYINSYIGHLKLDSESAYQALDQDLLPLDAFALFRHHPTQEKVIIHIISGRMHTPKPSNPWINLLLFIATIISVLITGTIIAIGEIGLTDPLQAQTISDQLLPNLWRGLPYALSIILILGSHEMGHYLMMRYYRIPASLPYFIPLPFISPFGTMGAAIMMKGMLKTRKALFDVGAAGPLAGFVWALPILFIGLATSSVQPMSGGMVEGNSLLYTAAKILTFGQFLPNNEMDVMLNQLAWAGWTGLFVTALNLIPLGQLDGGHIIYSLIGAKARKLFIPLSLVGIFMSLFISTTWILLFVLLLIFGRFYAVPYDDITPLNRGRKLIAGFTILLFIFIFVPIPLSDGQFQDGLITASHPLTLPLTISIGLLFSALYWPNRTRFRR
ncbi:hypothetical protein MASR2M15_07940 [Anaerolineales bacterium]